MVSRKQLNQYLCELLLPDTFSDYCPNGLQVEGCDKIGSIVTGVTACQGLIDAARERNVDAILVHHGYFWKGESPRVAGIKRHRLSALLASDMNLFAYHLPLDAHEVYGNNVQLAKQLGLPCSGPLLRAGQKSLVFMGEYEQPIAIARLLIKVEEQLQRQPLHLAGAGSEVTRIAWCTGAAQSYFEEAVLAGADVFITGEVSEQTFHLAQESGVHFIAAGHHATERYGIKALGEHLAGTFQLQHEFIDIDNPV